MENPEEVLQALDEFQKMRPSEIPRELEDYLCWVARTGDPVYQWSLVKALFREKLMRVMSEFYESCPTLDLTPCPNVEQFNYDIMKRNLLDRLESFANAPFTVQRICELLTTPRKEYNRIDKFMRAIEKNILVVSTREPGPYGRRSENGDGLVNGSVEDESSHHGQISKEVDMENWVKEYTATAAVPVHTAENDDMDVDNGLNSTLKTTYVKLERIDHQLSAADGTASSFVTSTMDFQSTTVTTQITVQESTTVVQNLTTVNHEATTIVGDVSDAIMNEDTSSQPSLELESDDNDSSDSKKLQTTFQAKDFTVDENKTRKTYSDALKGAKAEKSIETTEPSKECDQLAESTYSNEKLLNENAVDLQNSDKDDNLDVHSITNDDETDQAEDKIESEPQVTEKSESESSVSVDNLPLVTNNLDTKKDEAENNIVESAQDSVEDTCINDIKDENKPEVVDKEDTPDTNNSSENSCNKSEETESEPSIEVGKPIIEEPTVETTDSNSTTNAESTDLTIEETTEDDTKTTKTIVPDPIPIIEEPKDVESVAKDWDNSVSFSEVSSEPKDIEPAAKNGLADEPVKIDEIEGNEKVVTGCEETPSNKGVMESMDVDNEGLSVQQDEPMEQETTEPMNS